MACFGYTNKKLSVAIPLKKKEKKRPRPFQLFHGCQHKSINKIVSGWRIKKNPGINKIVSGWPTRRQPGINNFVGAVLGDPKEL